MYNTRKITLYTLADTRALYQAVQTSDKIVTRTKPGFLLISISQYGGRAARVIRWGGQARIGAAVQCLGMEQARGLVLLVCPVCC